MSAPIEELVTTLGLDVDANGLDEFVSTLKSGAGVIGGFVAASAGVATAIGKSFDLAAQNTELARLSDGLQISSQALQAFEFAGRKFGVSVGEIRGAITGLEEKIDEFENGLGDESLVSLAKLGIDPGELRDARGKWISELELFRRIVEAFPAAEERNPGLARAAVRDLVSATPQMVALLRGGSETLAEMTARAAKLRAIASDESIRASRDAINAWEDFGTAIDGIVNRHMAPGLDLVTTLLDEATGFLTSDQGDLWITEQIGTLKSDLETIGAFLDKVEEKLRQADALRVKYLGGDLVQSSDPVGIGSELGTQAREFLLDLAERLGLQAGDAPVPFDFSTLRAPIPLPSTFGLGVAALPPGVVPSAGAPSHPVTVNQEVHIAGVRDAQEAFLGAREGLEEAVRESVRRNAGVVD